MAKYDPTAEAMPDLFGDEPHVGNSKGKHVDMATSEHVDRFSSGQVNISTKPFTVRLPSSVIEDIERAFAQHALDTGRKANRSQVFSRLIGDHLGEYLGKTK